MRLECTVYINEYEPKTECSNQQSAVFKKDLEKRTETILNAPIMKKGTMPM